MKSQIDWPTDIYESIEAVEQADPRADVPPVESVDEFAEPDATANGKSKNAFGNVRLDTERRAIWSKVC